MGKPITIVISSVLFALIWLIRGLYVISMDGTKRGSEDGVDLWTTHCRFRGRAHRRGRWCRHGKSFRRPILLETVSNHV